jgi:hypothetical protein
MVKGNLVQPCIQIHYISTGRPDVEKQQPELLFEEHSRNTSGTRPEIILARGTTLFIASSISNSLSPIYLIKLKKFKKV